MDWIGKGVRKIVSVKQPFDSFWIYLNDELFLSLNEFDFSQTIWVMLQKCNRSIDNFIKKNKKNSLI